MTVNAVLFDLDDTLFDHQHCARTALLGIRDLHPALMAIEAARLEAAHSEILEELHLEVVAGRVGIDAARIERFRRLYRHAGLEPDGDLPERTALTYRDRYIQARTEVRGATRLLAAVRERARVVIVSNNLLVEQQAKLRHCGLDRHVDVLVVSEEAGVSKPDPAIFRIALDRAGVAPHEVVMVGDSWVNDVEGARAAGIRAIWFDRSGRPAQDPAVPVLRSLEPVERALEVIFAGARGEVSDSNVNGGATKARA